MFKGGDLWRILYVNVVDFYRLLFYQRLCLNVSICALSTPYFTAGNEKVLREAIIEEKTEWRRRVTRRARANVVAAGVSLSTCKDLTRWKDLAWLPPAAPLSSSLSRPSTSCTAAAAAAAAAAALGRGRSWWWTNALTVAETTIIETNHFVLSALYAIISPKPSHPCTDDLLIINILLENTSSGQSSSNAMRDRLLMAVSLACRIYSRLSKHRTAWAIHCTTKTVEWVANRSTQRYNIHNDKTWQWTRYSLSHVQFLNRTEFCILQSVELTLNTSLEPHTSLEVAYTVTPLVALDRRCRETAPAKRSVKFENLKIA